MVSLTVPPQGPRTSVRASDCIQADDSGSEITPEYVDGMSDIPHDQDAALARPLRLEFLRRRRDRRERQRRTEERRGFQEERQVAQGEAQGEEGKASRARLVTPCPGSAPSSCERSAPSRGNGARSCSGRC